MIALAFVLGATSAGALGVIVWLVYGRVAAADRESTARVARIIAESTLAAERFRLRAATDALESIQKRFNAFEKELLDAVAAPRNTDLAADDVDSRLSRLAHEAADAANADADGREGVPLEGAAGAAGAAPVLQD